MEEKVLKVRKNNKKLEDFDKQKIIIAIKNAADNAKQEIPDASLSRIANDIYNNFYEQKDVTIIKVEDISNLVEEKLMSSNYKDTARSYIKYHYDKEKERLFNSEIIKRFKKKLDGTNIENQNANVDEHTFSGRMQEAADVFLKEDALNNKMSKMARDNHNNNEIYTHDLSSFSAGMHNCLSQPLDEILENGFITRQTDIRSPRSISTALQLVAVLFQLQSLNQFGGVSATHLDFTMIPYIRYSFAKHYQAGMKYINNIDWKRPSDDKIKKISIENRTIYSDDKAYKYAFDMTKKETLQGCEGLYHNLNSLQSRSGAQLPFTSINYGACSEPEGQLMIDCLLDASIDGTGPLHKTPIFPCAIWQYLEGVNDKPGTPNYQLFRKAIKSTTMRIYPNYCKVKWSNNMAGVKIDRQIKQTVLDKLTDEQKQIVIKWVKDNEDKAKLLSLKVINNKLELEQELNYMEYNSTMGCRTVNLVDINFDEDYFKK